MSGPYHMEDTYTQPFHQWGNLDEKLIEHEQTLQILGSHCASYQTSQIPGSKVNDVTLKRKSYRIPRNKNLIMVILVN